jgi:hypothetical protein
MLNYELIKADYDGKQMAIDVYKNGKHFYTNLNNSDISDILSHRAHSLPLEKRLIKDFGLKTKSKKKTKSKTKTIKRKGKMIKRNKNNKKTLKK